VERPSTPEDHARWARDAAPSRLGPSQFHPASGAAAWPRLLMSRYFADLRSDLDLLLEQRARDLGAPDYDVYVQLIDRTEQMQVRLQRMVRLVPTYDYIAARKFLVSLRYQIEVGDESPEEDGP